MSSAGYGDPLATLSERVDYLRGRWLRSAVEGIARAEYGGYVMGVPNPRSPRDDPATPWDWLLRVLRHENWAVVILAQPITDDGRTSIRDGLLTESRIIRQAMGADAPGGTRADSSPLASLYLDLAKQGLTMMTEAQAVGAWRTAVYLLGGAPGSPHLAAAWKGLFTGLESGPLPVTVLTSRPAVGLGRGWATPDIDGPHGPEVRFSIHSPRRRC